MKRKYEELFAAPTTSTPTTAAQQEQMRQSQQEEAMKFVTEFKEKKAQQGKRMDWVEGTALKILNYKNSESLRQQFLKHSKEKSKETNSSNSNQIAIILH
ncbi:hypothetical protein G6F42_020531 [Rhizopus arrhizus]|nr:hypothetical protein G6F42_020531 [Rhizopus arrhizus]